MIDAQQAAFRGEYDSLQRFLPLMSAANIEQQALAQTGKRNASQLTAQEKAVAAFTLMFSGAGDALGDFDRTSDSAANTQRRLNAEWKNAKTELGEGLLPVMTELATFTNDTLVPAFKTFFTTGGDATGWAATIRNAISDLSLIHI